MSIIKKYTPAMSLIPLSISKRKARLPWRVLGITFLVLYLLLFSVFALFHVYAANELDNSHGCDIAQWIHLSQQAALFFSLVFAAVLLFNIDRSSVLLFLKTFLWSDHFKRGPPLPSI